jgi:dihydrodipicolinate synthase/N-acetylneuraminate lyase
VTPQEQTLVYQQGGRPAVGPQYLTRSTLSGIWASVLLPINRDNSIDLERLDLEVSILAASRIDGVYTNGTAGEFHAIGEDDYDAVSRIVANRCTASGMRFQLGASHMSGDISLARIERSLGLRPAGIQVILPDWCPLSDGEVIIALERMSEVAGPVPLTLYNPPGAKTRLDPVMFGRIARRLPRIVGIKVAGGDAAWFKSMQAEAPDLAIFVPGHLMASGFRLGAAGAYSNVACLSPNGAAGWFAMMKEDPRGADDLERRINTFLEAHVLPLRQAGHSDAALDKCLAHIGGWAPIGTRTRWPYQGVDEALAESLRPVARRELPELFADAVR